MWEPPQPSHWGRTCPNKTNALAKGLWKKWKRKDYYYDTMEIIVSNFKLDSSWKGLWERVGEGERKNYSFSAHVWKEGKTFPTSVIQFKCWHWFTALRISKLWATHLFINMTVIRVQILTWSSSCYAKRNPSHFNYADRLTITFLTESWS